MIQHVKMHCVEFTHPFPGGSLNVGDLQPNGGSTACHRLWNVLDILVDNGVNVPDADAYAGHATAAWRPRRGDGHPVRRRRRRRHHRGGGGRPVRQPVRHGVIPLGTANVLAQELGLPSSPRDIAAALAFGRTKRIWPGLARSTPATACSCKCSAWAWMRGGAPPAGRAETPPGPRRLCLAIGMGERRLRLSAGA